jgi:hypothetical protein
MSAINTKNKKRKTMNKIPKIQTSCRLKLFVCFLLLATSKIFAPPIICTVTTAADNGNNIAPTPGSLRECIIITNANVGFTNTINFNFLGTPIIPPIDLPTITNPVIIDGYLGMPGGAKCNDNPITAANDAVITIEIQGPGPGVNLPVLNGLVLGAGSDGSTIRGLSINSFASVTSPGGTPYGAGILILSNNNKIEGNFIGSDTTGFISLPNATAINVQGNDNIIGGSATTLPADFCRRNLLSGHYLGGTEDAAHINGVVRISGDRTIVQQNTVGLNRTGAAVLMPDAHQGITTVQAGATTGGSTLIGGPDHLTNGNVISGHHAGNVVVDLIASGNTVQKNYIGLDVSGTFAIPGNGIGVAFLRSTLRAPVNSLFQPVDLVISGNTISGNTFGVVIGENNFGSFPLFNTQVTNNIIGLDPLGATEISNSRDGVWVKYGIGTYIGSNIISGNGGNGIRIGKGKCSLIRSNLIGTDIGGTVDFGNSGNGIQLGIVVGSGIPASCDVIGGSKPGDGNLIANNNGNGIEIVSFTREETIIGNTIINNDLNGIALDPNSSNNWIGGFRSAGDLLLMGDTQSQGFTNLGPLGISNIIAGNHEDGINALLSNNNTIQSNFINTNNINGILLTDSSFNLVGGKFGSAATTVPPVLGNFITGNDGFGVEVDQKTCNATDNSILSNQIFNNTSKGIALVTG